MIGCSATWSQKHTAHVSRSADQHEEAIFVGIEWKMKHLRFSFVPYVGVSVDGRQSSPRNFVDFSGNGVRFCGPARPAKHPLYLRRNGRKFQSLVVAVSPNGVDIIVHTWSGKSAFSTA